jgi:dGTPase
MTLPTSVAVQPTQSRGRLFPEPASGPRGPRDIFQRDRDRIVHCVAFRRLRHKTQVFVAPDGDHFRVRLTHSLEVAQIGRTIARALALNEDLTEALCLAHDLGHPPFGHAGEDALDASLADAGGFDHNAHTLRIVTRLETPYPDFDGLNLSWEALEGLAKHNGPIADLTWALVEANSVRDLELSTWPSLEAQVAAISDDIAYDNHDVDDGLRAGLLQLDEILALSLVRRLWDAIGERHPGIPLEKQQRALVRDMIGVMVEDVLAETVRRVAQSEARSIDDVRRAGRPLVGFSDALAEEERELKRFLYDRLYGSSELELMRNETQRVVTDLAAAYRADPSLLPSPWQGRSAGIKQLRTIGDFIAGMTDRFAIARHEELVGPVQLPADRF